MTIFFATTSGPLELIGWSAFSMRARTFSAWSSYAVPRLTSTRLSREIVFHSVRIGPGSMITTRMPYGASSTRRLSLKPSTANLVAWYHAPSGS